MPKDDLEKSFPGLRTGGYQVTSPADNTYNCVAWAAHDAARWWDPSVAQGCWWPSTVPRALSLVNLIAVFVALGYQPCGEAASESSSEKVAIYSDDRGWPTHVARQLSGGGWTSKLGASEDIAHDTVEQLEGVIYGKVVCVLKRPRVVP